MQRNLLPMTPLQKRRMAFKPTLPQILDNLEQVTFTGKGHTSSIGDAQEIKEFFPKTFGQPILYPIEGARKEQTSLHKPLKVGVVFSGGPAAGGHNVITALFDSLQLLHPQNRLVGFLEGPSGIIERKYRDLSKEVVDLYRNQGGFDMIGSGRTKIESNEQLVKSFDTIQDLQLDGLVIIGGDDSNTNAAVLAEYCMQRGSPVRVIGVPKTIDGDLKSDLVEISFGFHSACQTYSELIGNIARDALSSKKYTHFIKLMGRSASHVSLECALQTNPNLTLIGEEILKKKQTLKEITCQIADLIEQRQNKGKNYSIILIPEGLIGFIPEIKALIEELNKLPSKGQDIEKLSKKAQTTLGFLPKTIQKQLLLDRDPHGNIQLSHIQTELLLSTTVKNELQKRPSFKDKFHAIHHFFGYEGRSGFPTYFDATYCYALGYVTTLLIREGYSGYMSCVRNLTQNSREWQICGVPITSLMNLEMRKGKRKPVIRKALVDLNGKAFKSFERERSRLLLSDYYLYPGPIQFEGEDLSITSTPRSLINSMQY